MNQRKKRRRDLERWRAERRGAVSTYGPSPLISVLETLRFFDAIRKAAVKFACAVADMGHAMVHVLQPILAAWPKTQPPEPAHPVTFADLCRDLGTDGASMPGARFTSEGGFTLN